MNQAANIKIVLEAVNNAQAALNDVTKQLQGVGETASTTQKQLGGLAGFKDQIEPAADASRKFGLALLGVGAVVGTGLGMAVKAASEAQVEMTKVDTIIKNSGGNFDATRKKILEASQAIIKLGFDDEDTALSIAYLNQRTGDMNKAMELNQLAMDLARAKNLSLGEATKMVGMVMSGNGRILKQYGIDIKESGTPLEALADLQDKVKGSAEAYSKSLQGQTEILNVQFQNLKEQVGDKLIPVLATLLTQVNNFINGDLQKWITKTEEIIDWLDKHRLVLAMVAGAIVGALIPSLISLGITIWTSVLPAIAAMTIALAPYLIGGAIIAGIVYAIYWVVTNWELVAKKLKDIWDKIKQYFKDTWDGIKLIFQGSIDWIMQKVDYVMGLVDKVKNAASGIGNSIGKGASAVGSFLGLADGGIVTRPTLAVVGEGGESEAVIPLSKLGGIGGGSIIINISGNTLLDENAAVKMGDFIVDRLRKNMRIPSRSF